MSQINPVPPAESAASDSSSPPAPIAARGWFISMALMPPALVVAFFVLGEFDDEDSRKINGTALFAASLLLFVPAICLAWKKRARFQTAGRRALMAAARTFVVSLAGMGVYLAQYLFLEPEFSPEGLFLHPVGGNVVEVCGLSHRSPPTVDYKDRPALQWALGQHWLARNETFTDVISYYGDWVEAADKGDGSLLLTDERGGTAHLAVKDGKIILLSDSHTNGRSIEARRKDNSFNCIEYGILIILVAPAIGYIFLNLALLYGFRSNVRPILGITLFFQALWFPAALIIHPILRNIDMVWNVHAIEFATLATGYLIFMVSLLVIRPISFKTRNGFDVIMPAQKI